METKGFWSVFYFTDAQFMRCIINYFFFRPYLGQQYCIQINSGQNTQDKTRKGHAVSIFKNGKIVDKTPSFSRFEGSHVNCFDSFDAVNDILVLRSGGWDAVAISVNLIHNGTTTRLRFGENENLKEMSMDNFNKCSVNKEVADAIKIQNGVIIESPCVIRRGNPTGSNNSHIINETICENI